MIALFMIAIACGFILLIKMVCAAFGNTVEKIILEFPEFPEQFGSLTVFFISDIHRRSIHHSIIDQVKEKADIVLIGGDLTEKGVPFSQVRANIKKLSQLAPVYFIWGNNDYEVDVDQLKDLFNECGVIVIKNETVILSRGRERIALIGLDDDLNRGAHLEAIVHSLDPSMFRLLISHNPVIVNLIDHSHHIPLILSGHTHGGQIRIFGFGPYEKGGLKKYPDTHLLTSNGYGTTLLPLRLGARAETHLITIQHSICQQAK